MTSSAVGLRPPRHRVRRRAIGWWTARSLLGAAPLLGGLGVAYTLVPAARPTLGPALVVVAVLAAGHAAVVPTWRYAVHRWETTDEAVYAASGWFVRQWRVAPMSRIQTVDRVAGPLQQLFDLATVTVTTASAQGPVKLVGLAADEAAHTARQLTELVRGTPGDAT
ncbi:PH domain-containing protein [Micromonospora sp. CA-263727]|uniref:PH domain-containing protein n=1 Tax=Micromonospora sp. CA-263727 TaxID=3239967 RepID=UPI003D93C830